MRINKCRARHVPNLTSSVGTFVGAFVGFVEGLDVGLFEGPLVTTPKLI